ncbi:MAG: hypothetical protein KKE11_06530, partial [Gammaproteobacteria bacterium]|nr:hypothetical protein [Gammaproteobacteria bacterium]
MKQPVEIGSVSVGIRGLEPALRLKKVTIFNDSKNKKILQAKELQIGIDLIGSLIKWKVKPGLLLVRGSEVAVYQNKSGKIGLVGASSQTTKVTEDDSVFDEIALWLFEQSRIDLEEIKLKWSLPNGDVIKVNDLYLSLNNGALQHELNLSGNLEQQDYPAKFKANFRLRGDLLKIPSFPLVGDVKILNWSYDLNSSRLSNNHLALPLSGNINLQIKDSKIKTKNFRQPMVINNLGAKVDWQHDGNKLKLNVSKLEFMDDWLSFYGGGQCLFLDNAPLPTVDLKLKFKLINLAKAKLYYPVSVLPSNATAWLDQAFTSSKLLSGNLILQGPLDKFPFDNNEGKFLIESTIRDVYLHYDPDWPLIEKISGKMTFANRSMTILANSAGIMGQPAKFIKAVIPDLDLPILYIDGAIDTDSSVGLKFVNSSPLKKTVGRKLQDIVLSGPMHFNLTMEMPLSDDVAKKDTQVEGDILLINNLVSSQDLGFNVSSLQGDLHFKDGDLVANNIQGKLFDRLLKLNISTLNPDTDDAITRVSLSGSAMMQDFERAFAVKLSPYMFGDFNFDALLDLYTSSTQNIFKLHSNLLGVGIDLPKPFDKKPDSSYEFDLSCYFGGNKNPQITVNYNNQISAALMVKKDSSGSLKMVGGEVKFGKTPAKVATSTGLVISGSLDELDWSVWKEYLRKAQGNFNAAGSVVRKVSLKIAKLRILGQLFNKISLDAQPKNDGWEIAILMPDIDGKIYFPNNNKKAIKGEFKKLYLNSKKQESLTELKPQDLPPLNFIINNFRYGNKYFNRVIFTSKPWDGGLKFDEIKIIDDGFEIDAGGEWLGVGNNQRSIFRGNVNSKDVGGLLKQLDFTDTM